jgi:hypothetical protein
MTAPTVHEVKTLLTETLRNRGARPSGLSFSVEPMSPAEVTQIEVRSFGDGELPPSQTVGFRVRFSMHRSTREASEQAMPQIRQALLSLGDQQILEGRATYDGIGQESELDERPKPGVFSWSVPVFLEVEGNGVRMGSSE